MDLYPDGREVIVGAPVLYDLAAANGAAGHLPPFPGRT
ncbi:Hypothetical protein A7982_06265 [Minicystis rosea]|nr:Hypothetical protein A7982_06265 [Minicystis rosea]